jgi:hypothetical protein
MAVLVQCKHKQRRRLFCQQATTTTYSKFRHHAFGGVQINGSRCHQVDERKRRPLSTVNAASNNVIAPPTQIADSNR